MRLTPCETQLTFTADRRLMEWLKSEYFSLVLLVNLYIMGAFSLMQEKLKKMNRSNSKERLRNQSGGTELITRTS